ncbi:hypothetical protein SNOG_13943 [Parastagonospora nodorum SN15]|uniref:Uncharacterized protein n=1 Tax=Phaeosphaeria nodorum (strain SN15 / ATCC MYA-4574 / FGSC 10173) TaxID=321614 RepID=Q0U2R7_PHANO|nr:hypothetical protein SNOG_13943 [Parastagonospora nodorum SN15]EAT78568.1 hypothetical protein SNOG_13943 [Parastagonospora nodorum SN15]
MTTHWLQHQQPQLWTSQQLSAIGLGPCPERTIRTRPDSDGHQHPAIAE